MALLRYNIIDKIKPIQKCFSSAERMISMLLQGKTAIITGGTRGIGLATVRVFLQNGARVALFGSRQETVEKALGRSESGK